MKAFKASTIYTGADVLHSHAVLVDNGRIHSVIPSVSVDAAIPIVDYGTSSISPPFIDLQIYGASGRLFGEDTSVETLEAMYKHCVAAGTGWFLPTVASNDMAVYYAAIDAVRSYWAKGGSGVLGLHIEGPWINPAQAGAQQKDLIVAADSSAMEDLLRYAGDVIRMITLAPECVTRAQISLIRDHNIVVSAGHSQADYALAYDAFENGVGAATHLYNGMVPFHHRSPGILGAVFMHPVVKAGIIADGIHVDYIALAVAKKLLGERLFIITDAVTQSNGVYPHRLVGDHYEIDGVLSGSAITLLRSVKNLIEHVGIEKAEALRMCSLYPARLLGKGDEMGMIKKGYPATFIVADDKMESAELITNLF